MSLKILNCSHRSSAPPDLRFYKSVSMVNVHELLILRKDRKIRSPWLQLQLKHYGWWLISHLAFRSWLLKLWKSHSITFDIGNGYNFAVCQLYLLIQFSGPCSSYIFYIFISVSWFLSVSLTNAANIKRNTVGMYATPDYPVASKCMCKYCGGDFRWRQF